MNEGIGYKIFKYFNLTFMILVAVVTILPYLNVLATSLNDARDTTLGGLTFYPRVVTFENYSMILENKSIISAFLLTVSIVILFTSLSMSVTLMAAYTLKKKRLVGRTAILIFLIIPNFFSGGLIPTYILFSKVHLLDNYLVYVLPAAFSFYNLIIIRTYMASAISDSLEESAKIDGANEFSVFLKIVLPLCKPVIATVVLWTAVYKWNDWTTTLYFVQRQNLFTLQYKLMQVVRESETVGRMIQEAIQRGADTAALQEKLKITPESLVAAQVMITTIPIVLVYPFLQKYFVHGVMIGAIKE